MVQIKKKSFKKSRKSQRGGTANACVLDYASSTPQYGGVGLTNIHNNNPEASIDLDNKFKGYGGPVPLGSGIVGGSRKSNKKNSHKGSHKGGSSCGTEGVGTGSPKKDTFKQYLTNLDSKLSSVTGGSPNSKTNPSPEPSPEPSPNSKPHSNNNKTNGGGYSSDPSEIIGGLSAMRGYPDNSPPAIIGGQLVFGSPDQPVCGNGAVSGGSRRLRKSRHSSKKNKHNKSKKSKKSKKSMKNKKNKKHQRGGSNDFRTLNSSNPAEYASAFGGEPGYFKYPDDMTERSFEAQQPNWGAKGI